MEAVDGQQAIETFRKYSGSIDCVLLDLNMPKSNGEEVHRELRAIREDVPIILMSGYTEEHILRQFAGVRVTGFLQKPIAAANLIAMMNAAAWGTPT